MNNKNIDSAIERLKAYRPEIAHVKRGLPNTGKRCDGKRFYPGLSRIERAYRLGNEVYSKDWEIDPSLTAFNSGNGSPIRYLPFPLATKEGIEALTNPTIAKYPFAAGDADCRKRVADYLFEIGLRSENAGGAISPNHVIFFNSTTEAFSMLLKVICRKGDVVLFTAPTYGLFCYAPERLGAISCFIPLHKENDWLINPLELENTILKINARLRKTSHNKTDYIPRVVAFLNLNPCNPTGLVMDETHISLLREIHSVCLNNGVFLIDDIIYRDLCYNMSKPAVPIASIKGAFTNTITLFGTSKSFCLAGARAGGIAADEIIIRGLRNEIFQQMDSSPMQVSKIMAGAFQTGEEYRRVYNEYFTPLISLYKENWNIVKTLINGIDKNCPISHKSMSLIYKEFGNESKQVLKNGIEALSIAGEIEPESGFFALLDFTALIGKMQPETNTKLKSEIDVLYYFYKYANVKLLTGSSFAWPIFNQVVARLSFAYTKDELIRMIHQIYMAVRKLL